MFMLALAKAIFQDSNLFGFSGRHSNNRVILDFSFCWILKLIWLGAFILKGSCFYQFITYLPRLCPIESRSMIDSLRKIFSNLYFGHVCIGFIKYIRSSIFQVFLIHLQLINVLNESSVLYLQQGHFPSNVLSLDMSITILPFKLVKLIHGVFPKTRIYVV